MFHTQFARQVSSRISFSNKRAVRTYQRTLVTTTLHDDGRTATLTLDRPPANSLNKELNDAICDGLANLRDRSVIVINSSSAPSIFSAGLDLETLCTGDETALRSFWTSLQQVFIDLYSSPATTIAAIDGHAPAAGCMIAMACDYRIMLSAEGRSSSIGLNEVKLGIAAPYWMADLMVHTIGIREAEKALGLGILYSPKEALDVGLVDEIYSTKEEMDHAVSMAVKRWASIPIAAKHVSKLLTRQKVIEELKARREEDVDTFCKFVLNEKVQQSLGAYIDNLKRKKH